MFELLKNYLHESHLIQMNVHSFIHSFKTYLLISYSVPRTELGSRHPMVIKPCVVAAIYTKEREKNFILSQSFCERQDL